MKNFIKWKILIFTCAACVLPIFLGLAFWDKLPDQMAIHFDMYNVPNGFSSKAFALFGLPCLMVLLQIICCVINDINAKRFGERKKFSTITKWIIPVMSFLLYIVTLLFNLGSEIDIRKVAMIIVAAIFLVIGNYLPKFDYIKNYNASTEDAKRINRFIGFATVVMGLLAIISVFLPPIASVIWLFLLFAYAAVSIIVPIIMVKKNNRPSR